MRRALAMIVLFAGIASAAAPVGAFWHGPRGWGYGSWGGYYGSYGCGPTCCGGPACCGAPVCFGGYGAYGVGLGVYAYRPFVYPRTPGGYFAVPPAATPMLNQPPAAAPAPSLRPTSAPPVSDLDRVLGRVANVEKRRKAERMLAEGDELFRAQNFHSALQRYKLAASTAPDFAEAFWRKGHALVATHNYELAIAAFRRAIDLGDDLNRDGFRLDDIYGAAKVTKTLQFEALAEWALARTYSAEAWFLVGASLYYDGQQPRAEKFLARAQALAGFDDGYVAAFSRRATIATTKSPIVPAMTFGRET